MERQLCTAKSRCSFSITISLSLSLHLALSILFLQFSAALCRFVRCPLAYFMKCRYVHRWPSVSSSTSLVFFHRIVCFAEHNISETRVHVSYSYRTLRASHLHQFPKLHPHPLDGTFVCHLRPLEMCDRISRCFSIFTPLHLALHPLLVHCTFLNNFNRKASSQAFYVYVYLQAICYLIYMILPLKIVLLSLPYVCMWLCVLCNVHTCVSFTKNFWEIVRCLTDF